MLEVRLTKRTGQFTLQAEFSAGHEVVGILGPSGSGKSMTLGCIAGLVAPDEGWIRLNGRTLYDSAKGERVPPRLRRIGYVFQNYALFPHLTVGQNIAYGIHHLPRQERREQVEGMLSRMRLDKLIHQYPSQLSGGQQQRVALARTLITQPELLLLDEPFSAVDNHVKHFLEQELLSMIDRNYKGTVLLVTHNIEEAYRLCSRIMIYDQGKIVQNGPKEDVVHRPTNVSAARITGCKNFVRADEVIQEEGGLAVRAGELCLAAETDVPNHAASSNLYAAFRAHYVEVSDRPFAGPNSYSSRIVRAMEGRFHVTLVLDCCGHHIQAEISAEQWQRMPRAVQSVYVRIPPERVFLVEDNAVTEPA